MAAAATVARRTPAPSRTARVWATVGVGCVVLAVLSLLAADQTTYDPTAWLIWGREVVHGGLSTRVGPSWKPLPIVVTAPASLLGDTAQQDIWLVVARTGTLAAIALAYRLAWRLEGAVAGVIAAASLVLATSFVSRTFRGDSEGLLVAIVFGAIEAHLCGRRRLAFGLVVAATLLRPEVCVFAAGYGLWLVATAPTGAARAWTFAVAAGAGALVVAAWLIPEQIGSGHLFRAASRALLPVAGSPATAAFPFGATFTNAVPALPWPLYAAGIDPSKAARKLTPDDYRRLHAEIRRILLAAIRSNGTTVRDYRTGTGEEGSFQLELLVYGREGEPCRRCGTRLTGTHAIDARITVFCHRCQS